MRIASFAALFLTLTACGSRIPPTGSAPGEDAETKRTEAANTAPTSIPPATPATPQDPPEDPAPPVDPDPPACDSATVTPAALCAVAFTPPTDTEPWQRITTSMIVLLGEANHRGVDVIVNPGQEQVLIGKFTYGIFDKDLKGERVEVWAEVACGDWRLLGSGDTSKRSGENPSQLGIDDDGGRLFFTIPADQRLGVGDYRIKLLVKGDHSSADFWLHVWNPGTHAVVSDIDGTITTQETDGFWTLFDPSSPVAQLEAAAAFRAYASKNYRIIYLTARPEFLSNATQQWFYDQGFPPGTFHLSPSNFGVQDDEALEYKQGFLEAEATDHGVALDWAYGNKETDLDAYLGAGIAPAHVYLLEGEYDGPLKGATQVPDYASERARIECEPMVSQP